MSELRKLGQNEMDELRQRSKPIPQISPLPNDTSTESECEHCGGARVVKRPLKLRPDGAVFISGIARCQECNPERPYGIPQSRLLDSFENFDLKRNPGMAESLSRCRAVSKGAEWCAVMVGGFGTGKTHLAIAALNAYGRGEFWKVPDLLDWLRSSYSDGGTGIEVALARFRESSGLLVLDDFGTEKGTEWASEQLYRILDSRYDMRLPTIITSNRDFDRIDGRIRSRYGEGLALCRGADVRRKVKGAVTV